MRQPVLMRGDPPAEQRKQLDALTQTPCLCAPHGGALTPMRLGEIGVT
jgi:hypothetical protein